MILVTLIGKLPFEVEVTISVKFLKRDFYFVEQKLITQLTFTEYVFPQTKYKHTQTHSYIHKNFKVNTNKLFLQIGYFNKLGISFFFLSLIILFAGDIPLLCVSSPNLQRHLASIKYLQQKWLTDVWALLYFGIEISDY